MVGRKVIGRELRRHAAPAERHAGADHRYDRPLAPKRTQDVRQHARHAQRDQHDRDRQRLATVVDMARRSRQRGPYHANHDRRHGNVLVAPRRLAEHALSDQQQYQQPSGQRRLYDHQRSEQQSQHL